MFNCLSFAIREWWGTLSTAFRRLKKMAHTSEPLSRVWCQSWVADRTASVVDLPGRKPHCLVEMGACSTKWSWSTLLIWCSWILDYPTDRSQCIVHGFVDFPNAPLLYMPCTNYFTRYTHPLTLLRPQTRTNYFYFSFFPHAVAIWNSLHYLVGIT